jgi:hypothetical protein
LAVQRVDLDDAFAQQCFENAAGLDEDVVRDAVLGVLGILISVAVIAVAFYGVDRLKEAAAECDIGFLKPPADRKQRHSERDDLRDDGQRPCVAFGV